MIKNYELDTLMSDINPKKLNRKSRKWYKIARAELRETLKYWKNRLNSYAEKLNDASKNFTYFNSIVQKIIEGDSHVFNTYVCNIDVKDDKGLEVLKETYINKCRDYLTIGVFKFFCERYNVIVTLDKDVKTINIIYDDIPEELINRIME